MRLDWGLGFSGDYEVTSRNAISLMGELQNEIKPLDREKQQGEKGFECGV